MAKYLSLKKKTLNSLSMLILNLYEKNVLIFWIASKAANHLSQMLNQALKSSRFSMAVSQVSNKMEYQFLYERSKFK
jgi:hypothetical protein